MQAKSRRPLIGELWNSIQTWLLPVLEDELGELDEQHRQFVSVCECGWETLGEVPSESTFSRAFGQFSSDNRPQTIHAALIKTHDGEKIAGHISRDATAIHAREKAVAKAQEKTSQSKKECWCGYKLHRDVIDGDIPVSAILTSASLQHGGRHVHVRGPVKLAAHLAFGLVVIAAEQMLRMLG